jgi:hypothetical protein
MGIPTGRDAGQRKKRLLYNATYPGAVSHVWVFWQDRFIMNIVAKRPNGQVMPAKM